MLCECLEAPQSQGSFRLESEYLHYSWDSCSYFIVLYDPHSGIFFFFFFLIYRPVMVIGEA